MRVKAREVFAVWCGDGYFAVGYEDDGETYKDVFDANVDDAFAFSDMESAQGLARELSENIHGVAVVKISEQVVRRIIK